MKSYIVAVAFLVLAGCKGKDGSAGATGIPGAPGAPFSSSMVNLNGVVTSNSIAVIVPGLNISRGDILAVYTCIATACVQINIWQAGIGNNMFYVAQGTTVTISNALAGSQTLWYISAVEKI